MSQNVEMSGVGSLTVAALVVAVIFLLRSFYKRFTRMDKARQSQEMNDTGENESK
ncbi:MAG: hypothetical protein NTX12_05615 [Actinobacteria bacterium]|nr:hypothetical protein [Actinomycetota bacterium]